MTTNWQTLQRQLSSLEGRSYRKYKSIKGDYEFPDFKLAIDYVQSDPFAAPSRIRIRLNQLSARFPALWLTNYVAQVAIADYLTRQVAQVAQFLAKKRGSGKSGSIGIAAPSQAILRRTAIWIDAEGIEARLTVGLPALGRRIAGHAAAELLCDDISQLVAHGLKYAALDSKALTHQIQTLQEAEALRSQLAPNGLIAMSLSQVLDRILEDIKRGGLNALAVGLAPEKLVISGDLAEFRRFELAATINRLRALQVVPIA